MRTFVALTLLALAMLVAGDFIRAYCQASGDGWDRVLAAGRGSATIAWQQFGVVVAALIAGAQEITDWICAMTNAPGADEAIKSAIQSAVTPTNVGLAVAIYIGITVLARLRTLKSSSDA